MESCISMSREDERKGAKDIGKLSFYILEQGFKVKGLGIGRQGSEQCVHESKREDRCPQKLFGQLSRMM